MSSSSASCRRERLVAGEPGRREHGRDHLGVVLATMPSASPGSKTRPEPARSSSRWIVSLPERVPFRLTSSVISAANGLALDQAAGPAAVAKSTWMISPRAAAAACGSGAAIRASSSSERPVHSAAGAFVVEIAVDARGDAHAAELLEARVDPLADLAEVDVARIAERQHGKAQPVETRRVLGHQRLIELDRPLGRIALAPGAGDHQQLAGVGEIGRRHLGHVEQLGGEALLGRDLPRIGRDALGVAGLGPVQDGQRDLGARRRRGRRRARRPARSRRDSRRESPRASGAARGWSRPSPR